MNIPSRTSRGGPQPLGAPNDTRGGPHGTARPGFEHRRLTGTISLLPLSLALFLGGCGNAAQRQAYEHAAQGEQQMTTENSPAIIAEYRQVIALQPGSDWAKKAQARIEAVEARLKAEELHKSVFQEHGID